MPPLLRARISNGVVARSRSNLDRAPCQCHSACHRAAEAPNGREGQTSQQRHSPSEPPGHNAPTSRPEAARSALRPGLDIGRRFAAHSWRLTAALHQPIPLGCHLAHLEHQPRDPTRSPMSADSQVRGETNRARLHPSCQGCNTRHRATGGAPNVRGAGRPIHPTPTTLLRSARGADPAPQRSVTVGSRAYRSERSL